MCGIIFDVIWGCIKLALVVIAAGLVIALMNMFWRAGDTAGLGGLVALGSIIVIIAALKLFRRPRLEENQG